MAAAHQSVHDETLQREVSTRSSRARRIRAWEVVHACDFARDIADVVEAQISAGMRPYLLTVGADVTAKKSLLQTWQDVRRWKKAFDESGAHTTPQLIHAHSFSSGMAAARMGACLVYDLRQPIEERLATTSANPPGTWLSSSYRTAEQFVLSKAAAVVVHSPALREDCIARGVSPQSVFVIPDLFAGSVADSTAEVISESERAHIREANSPQRIAEKYDEVYRYAYERKRKGGSADSSGSLIPIQANF